MFILVWDPNSYTIKLRRGHSCKHVYKHDTTKIQFIDRLRNRHALDQLLSPIYIVQDELAKFIADNYTIATIPRQDKDGKLSIVTHLFDVSTFISSSIPFNNKKCLTTDLTKIYLLKYYYYKILLLFAKDYGLKYCDISKRVYIESVIYRAGFISNL